MDTAKSHNIHTYFYILKQKIVHSELEIGVVVDLCADHIIHLYILNDQWVQAK